MVEVTLPLGVTVDEIAPTAPPGHAVLVAGRDGTDLSPFVSPQEELIPFGTRLYNPYLQGVVVEDVKDLFIAITAANECVFANDEAAELTSFNAVVQFVDGALA